MFNECEKCRYFYKFEKEIQDKDGFDTYIPQYQCKLGHKITETSEGWFPSINKDYCPDFKKKR